MTRSTLRAIVRDASTLGDPAGVEVIEGDLADPRCGPACPGRLRPRLLPGAFHGGGRRRRFRCAQIVDRLPVLALPSWRDTKSQPVGIADVVAALLGAADVTPGVYEIAGPDTLTIEEMVKTIGELNGKVRPSFPLPFTSSRLEGAATALVA